MAYSKRPDLLFDLARAVERLCSEGVDEPGGVCSVRSEQAPRVWRVRDRLSEADIRSLQPSLPVLVIRRRNSATPLALPVDPYRMWVKWLKPALRRQDRYLHQHIENRPTCGDRDRCPTV
jgi:hypothetical protein